MTSRKSFFDLDIMIQSVKQSKYIMILHTILLFLITTFPAYVTLQNMKESTNPLRYSSELSMWATGCNVLVGFAAIVIPIITAIYLFSYLFKPNSVQFFNSMPYTRVCMYTSRFAACVVSLILPILLVFAVNSVIYVSAGLSPYFPYSEIVAGLACEILSYVVMMCICAFAVSLSGNAFAMFIVIAFAGLWYVATTSAIYMSITEWADDLYINFSYDAVGVFPPLLLILKSFGETVYRWQYIYSIVCAIVFFALGLFAYVKRRAENTNKFFAYKGIGSFLKYYVSLIASLAFGAVFLMLGRENIVVGYIGYLLILFIAYVLMQAIFEKDMRGMFANMKHFAVFAVIWAIVLLPMNMGVLDKIKPNIGNSRAVAVDEFIWRDEKNIEAVRTLVETAGYEEGKYVMMKTLMTNPDNPLFRIKRYISLAPDDIADYERVVYNSEEYRNMLIEALNRESPYAWIRVAFNHYSIYMDEENTDVRVDYINNSDLKVSDYMKLREILKGEIVKYDYETCVESGCFAEIGVQGYSEWGVYNVPIYCCYEETVRFMKEEMGISVTNAEVIEAKVFAGSVRADDDGGQWLFKTSDSEEIETLLSCANGKSRGGDLVTIMVEYESGYDSLCVSYDSLSNAAKELIESGKNE